MSTTDAGASPVERGVGRLVPERAEPRAWMVMAHGCVQKIVVRADVADELACKWRETDPEADALPLYDQSAIDAARVKS